MLEAGEWGFDQWTSVLPLRAVARLAAARALREKGHADADRLLAMVLAGDVETPARPGPEAEHNAAQAEALALMERRVESAERYRRAIERADEGAARRRYSLALAAILAPLAGVGQGGRPPRRGGEEGPRGPGIRRVEVTGARRRAPQNRRPQDVE
jgi:hypothetical protein